MLPPLVLEFARRAAHLPWVTDVWVGGSVARGDYRAGVSDIDVVAGVERDLTDAMREQLTALHRAVDGVPGPDANLGCTYVTPAALADPNVRCATWTHGVLIDRPLSPLERANLGLGAVTLAGRAAALVWPTLSPAEVRAAVVSDLRGFWALAARQPLRYLDVAFADFALLTMARARSSLRHGRLVTKTEVVADVRARPSVRAGVIARRAGRPWRGSRVALGVDAWRDVRATLAGLPVQP